MSMLIRLAALAALAGVGACAPPKPPAPTIESTSQAVTAEAVIERIDHDGRQIWLKGADGRRIALRAGPAIEDLGHLEVGDRVRATFMESLTLSVANPAAAPETFVSADAEAGGGQEEVGATVSSVVRVIGYDPSAAVLTFADATGAPHSVPVPAAMRDFASGMTAGEVIAIQYSEAVAVTLQKV